MATIVMEAAKVIEAADKVLAQIKEIRAKEDAETIETMRKKMYTIRWSPYPKITRGPYTDEEVIKEIKSSSLSAYNRHFPSSRRWGDYATARKLRLIALHGDPVTLNQDDVDTLFG